MSERPALGRLGAKTLESGGHRFELDVPFRSDATRLVLFGPRARARA
jgi:hypothetical protein